MASRVIAIDGPSASGKSSTARAVAQVLGFAHLDSGALYRGVTLVGLREAARRGLWPLDPAHNVEPEVLLRAAEDRGLKLLPDDAGFATYLEGEPVDVEIRSHEVTAHVSAISAISVVREWVNSYLRSIVRAGSDVVIDGRDIGTVVFPEAELKVFLTASPEARAGRRIEQRGLPVDAERLRSEAAALAARDLADSSRPVAPLRRSDDAIDIDTTSMRFPEQVEFIVTLAREKFTDR
ncbi:MAG: (d)CMP kinase [Gemmatimonadota bacterium]